MKWEKRVRWGNIILDYLKTRKDSNTQTFAATTLLKNHLKIRPSNNGAHNELLNLLKELESAKVIYRGGTSKIFSWTLRAKGWDRSNPFRDQPMGNEIGYTPPSYGDNDVPDDDWEDEPPVAPAKINMAPVAKPNITGLMSYHSIHNPPPKTVSLSEDQGMINEAISKEIQRLKEFCQLFQGYVKESEPWKKMIEEKIKVLEERLEEFGKIAKSSVKKIEIHLPANKILKLDGVTLPAVFDDVLDLAKARRNILLCGPAGCIGKDTHIAYVIRNPDGQLRNKKGGPISLLFERFHNEPELDFYVQSVDQEGRVFRNRIENVVYSGVKETRRVVTSSGKVVEATTDHEFLTEHGYRPLSEIKEGDLVYTNPGETPYKGGRKPRPYRKEVLVKYHPTATIKNVGGYIYYRLRVYRAMYEADKNNLSYKDYIKLLNSGDHKKIDQLWTIPAGRDIHHKDENPFNNDLGNIKLKEKKRHLKHHSNIFRENVAIYTKLERITSIRKIGKQKTYDIVCADPHRNFVADGVVVHNCGKTHIGELVHKTLDLPFGYIGCTSGMTEAHLLGRAVQNITKGKVEYQGCEFLDCYENGGVFVLDELDAADPNMLLCLNAGLANGYLAVPNRPEKPRAKQHRDFICIGTANTIGKGANRIYSGRNPLDGATRDRFKIGTVDCDYDPTVELAVCPDDSLRGRLQDIRKKMRDAGHRQIISTRFLKDAYIMKEEIGWNDKKIVDILMQDWSEEERACAKESAA